MCNFLKCILCILVVAAVSCTSDFHQVSENSTVLIQPFKGFDSKIVDSIAVSLEELYGMRVDIAEEIETPDNAFIEVKSARYRADTLIRFLRDRKEIINADFTLGLIKQDISCTKYSDYKSKTIKSPEYKYKDWGIYGLGFCPGPSCIVSSYRLKKGTSKVNFIARMRKVSCHEIGHNLGLPHCPDEACIMQDAAESMSTVDGVKLHLCNECRSKIGLEKAN
ncbi:MAG: archaemetzincin [Parvicella sp.]|jgi:archaemetzincin